NPKKILDMYFFALAKHQDKPVHGLEKARDQLAVLNSVPLKKQAELLVETAKTKGIDAGMDSLSNAYYERDLNKLFIMATADTSLGMEFNKKLLDNRNIVMAAGINRLVHRHSTFVAIGAAHLPGPTGLIELLRKKGYKVKPVLSDVFLKP